MSAEEQDPFKISPSIPKKREVPSWEAYRMPCLNETVARQMQFSQAFPETPKTTLWDVRKMGAQLRGMGVQASSGATSREAVEINARVEGAFHQWKPANDDFRHIEAFQEAPKTEILTLDDARQEGAKLKAWGIGVNNTETPQQAAKINAGVEAVFDKNHGKSIIESYRSKTEQTRKDSFHWSR